MGALQRHHRSSDGSSGEPTLTRTSYGAEGQPGEVTLWTSWGAGHTWPGAHLGLMLSLFLGRTSGEIDASRSIWEFGLRHADDP